jgi:hypothetical protein
MKRTFLFMLIIASILTPSCSKSQSSAPVTRSFSLQPWQDDSRDSLTGLSMEVPENWKMNQDDKTLISFRPPGIHEAKVLAFVSINLASCLNKNAAACLEYTIERQFRGLDPSRVVRENLSPSRVWVVSEDHSKGLIKTGRFFVVNEKTGRIATASFILKDDTLPYFEAYQSACKTLAFD